jgi:hypothetical protein
MMGLSPSDSIGWRFSILLSQGLQTTGKQRPKTLAFVHVRRLQDQKKQMFDVPLVHHPGRALLSIASHQPLEELTVEIQKRQR